MNRSAEKSLQGLLHRVTSIVTLALWRWRQHWFLLLLTGIGMVAAITLVCTVPLLTAVMQTAGLRSVLTASPASAELTLRTTVVGLSTQALGTVNQFANPPLQDHLKDYLGGPPRLEIQTPEFDLVPSVYPTRNTPLQLYGNSMPQAAPHVTLVQGRLPRMVNRDIEIALTPATAYALHARVGSVITLESTFYTVPAAGNAPVTSQQSYVQQIKLSVVGLFEVRTSDPFWHGEDFQPAFIGTGWHYSALVSTQALLAAFDRIAANYVDYATYFSPQDYAYIYRYYYLDSSRVSINQLDNLIGQLAAIQEAIAHTNGLIRLSSQSVMQQVDLYSPVLSNAFTSGSLERFRSRVAVAGMPVAILALEITCLILFFASVMVGLLVERQVDTIAFLRSRGASNSQIFGAHLTQCLILSLFALLAGPLLAFVVVYFVSQRLLPATAQDALGVLTNAPLAALLSVKWYVLVTVGVIIAVMIFALYRASQMHVLAGRRDTARSKWHPLWQRLNLDLVASIIALTGYGISVYLADVSGLLDARTQALVATPVTLIAPVFLVLAAVLLFLRLFPLFLHLGSRFVARGRGAASMLALAQVARSPRQSVRMLMLLALAAAFAMFTLVFAASQAQRAADISAYQSGADFSGTVPSSAQLRSLKVKTKLYRNIAGVTAATTGYVGEVTSGATSALFTLQVRAVDPATFAQTAIWTSQNSSQPLASLLAQLAVRRNAAIRQGVIPAIVDAYTWNRLGLHAGEAFFVQQNSTLSDTVRYIAIAEVQRIPPINSSLAGVDLLPGNLIVDYQTFASIQKKNFGKNTPANYVWLRTSDDPAVVAHVRKVLQASKLHLDNLYDRRALIDALQADPLYLHLIVILALGTTAALLLALMGNLLASWLSVRRRLTNFAVLRALGATPKQVAGVLMWEQGIVYAAALLTGLVFGWVLSATAVPALVFTSVPASSVLNELSTNQFYSLQQAVPVHVVFPISLGIAIGVLVAICAIVLGMMMWVVLHPSMNQKLRLHEDASIDFFTREDVVMARSARVISYPARRAFVPSMVKLAFWQLRQAWFPLLMTGAGLIAAIVIVCTIPLFSAVMTTAGLRDTLNAAPGGTEITLDTSTLGLSTPVVKSVQRQLDPYFQAHLGTYLGQPASFSIQVSGFTFISPSPPRNIYQLNLFATSIEQAASHLTLLQGRLPQTSSRVIETLLTPSTASSLRVKVGAMMKLHFQYASRPQGVYGRRVPLGTLNLRVVGLFQATPAYLWHGNNFQPLPQGQLNSYTLLIPSSAFLAALDHRAAASHADAVFLPNSYELLWDYHLDTSRMAYSQLADLTGQLTALQADIQNKYGNTQTLLQAAGSSRYPDLLQAIVYDPVFGSFDILSIVEGYLNRVDVFRIPAAMLALQIIGLILVFISLMVDILVDRQAEAIAVLRSRGASSSQVATFLITQGISVGLVALIIGPPLAIMAVSLISRRILDPNEQGAISTITSHPVQAALDIGWYAVATALIVIVAMSLLLRRAVSMNVLSLRREAARSSRKTLWHHLRLDGGAVVVALTAYGLSVYLNNLLKQLDIGAQTLFSAPLTIVASIFFIIGIIILFLRFFPFLLRLAAWLTVRSRGAAPMLALAQMARSPRHAVRMTLLLAFAIAFAIFTFVFTASQARRITDISSYEVGADFSGDISHSTDHFSLREETELYTTIPGVTSATVGYTAEGFAAGTYPSIPVQLMAVDTTSFGRTAIWTSQDSSQPLASLLAQLAVGRHQAIKARVVPVIVDAAAARELRLTVGAPFTVIINGLLSNPLNCIVIAQVQHIPAVNNSAGNTGDTASPAGVLLDFATYASVFGGISEDNLFKAGNHIWLRTSDDPAALAHVRAALQTKDLLLANLYDRRALSDELNNDPLYHNLLAFLTLGAITALLLALLADLLASWLSVRTRLTNFAALRAQGATPRQTASVLTWEQGIVHALALMLGGVFGAVLSMIAVPALIFTNIPAGGVLSNAEFYTIQQVIPPQLVIPSSLGIVLLTLLAIFVAALTAMIWRALQPSLGQVLRLNQD